MRGTSRSICYLRLESKNLPREKERGSFKKNFHEQLVLSNPRRLVQPSSEASRAGRSICSANSVVSLSFGSVRATGCGTSNPVHRSGCVHDRRSRLLDCCADYSASSGASNKGTTYDQGPPRAIGITVLNHEFSDTWTFELHAKLRF
jgi:hypothetical protein